MVLRNKFIPKYRSTNEEKYNIFEHFVIVESVSVFGFVVVCMNKKRIFKEKSHNIYVFKIILCNQLLLWFRKYWNEKLLEEISV